MFTFFCAKLWLLIQIVSVLCGRPRASSFNKLWVNDIYALWRTRTSTFFSQNHTPKCVPSTNTAKSRLQLFIFICCISYFLRVSWYLTEKTQALLNSELSVPRGSSTAPKLGHGGQNQTRITALSPLGEKREEGRGDKSEGVAVPPVDLLTGLLSEIVHSKHSFCWKCLLKKKSNQKSMGNVQFQQQF